MFENVQSQHIIFNAQKSWDAMPEVIEGSIEQRCGSQLFTTKPIVFIDWNKFHITKEDWNYVYCWIFFQYIIKFRRDRMLILSYFKLLIIQKNIQNMKKYLSVNRDYKQSLYSSDMAKNTVKICWLHNHLKVFWGRSFQGTQQRVFEIYRGSLY